MWPPFISLQAFFQCALLKRTFTVPRTAMVPKNAFRVRRFVTLSMTVRMARMNSAVKTTLAVISMTPDSVVGYRPEMIR